MALRLRNMLLWLRRTDGVLQMHRRWTCFPHACHPVYGSHAQKDAPHGHLRFGERVANPGRRLGRMQSQTTLNFIRDDTAPRFVSSHESSSTPLRCSPFIPDEHGSAWAEIYSDT
ncbi:uncharacterized protein LAESUDRAFT_728197 [Laetiporus sulphureus 93-53]|uniref:Uncharacterized protein n=1 Tax=Laetiporus sulphureus 93-53 TaxID=1314785 RepID=A0A165D940_9APHY|nr:uncharacterized protein LAESUDRAFT_728197 [Laetiporus sulphureus 93-53]KZT04361.1 hypothetical protein LAESUDRAFT_728197 [Laetiporus sulphureus 93-53]